MRHPGNTHQQVLRTEECEYISLSLVRGVVNLWTVISWPTRSSSSSVPSAIVDCPDNGTIMSSQYELMARETIDLFVGVLSCGYD